MRYMLLIYGPDAQPGQSADAPAPDMAPWFEYGNWLTERGWFRGGDPLAATTSSTTVKVRDGNRLVTDGPFAETKEVLGGYYVIECDNLDQAIEAAARCPGALYGSMEVRPIVGMPAEPERQAAASA